MHHTILAPLSHRRQSQVARVLALALLPLLLGLGGGHGSESLPAAVSAMSRTGTVRWVRRRVWQRPARAARVWPITRQLLRPVLAQAGLLALLLGANRVAPPLLLLASLPLLRALLTLSALVWPRWGQRAACRWLIHMSAALQLALLLTLSVGLLRDHILTASGLLAAVAVPRPPKPRATGRILDDGTYEVSLGTDFVIRHKPVDEFDRRLFLLFLRDIHLVHYPSKWPFLCQSWLADWFGTLQELISRWEDYREAGDWQRLMSRHDGPLLPYAQRQELIQLWARHLWWSVAEVQAAAAAEGLTLSAHAINQIGQESGLLVARRVLRERFQLSAETLRPKDDWLVTQLFALLDQLQARLARGEPPTAEERSRLADLLALRRELGLGSGQELERPLAWGYHLQHILCGDWETVDDGSIRCPHCGSSQVRRKSRTPRAKRYIDAAGQVQTLDVFRYYCQNTACAHGSFTSLPPDLLPYSPWRTEVHLQALQAYELGHSSYRRVAAGLGVSTATAYRWVSQFGGQLLPVAALFGVVRSSGVVGVDEKWVKVPTNDKPAGKQRHWMYVYVAVDCYSYDLLHVALYPVRGTDAARAFLLGLRAKGYQPQVIVTDLCADYDRAIPAVFPHAVHHQCIFHALQAWHTQLRDAYGKHYRVQRPDAVKLQNQLDGIFHAKTKRTAQRRYDTVLALREAYVAQTPEVEALFASLERHWPKLVNAIESDRIPKTNNTAELVNRRFDQHYQTFCGFDTITTAQTYLTVFEWCYRFTPFTPDAQQRIRGKCPLELAGYDVATLPMAQICRGQMLHWPPEALGEVVPRT
ncbi:transposase [Oscillochloris sp. ZM17-4]|uniref:IS66 family transposase n=1 Tax=Oscillochloris sp. ZM17-4 TaxID=2866714 RepID=UPI001C73433F|nr:transposase [Oscillochloris sp. ZM17-4]